MPKKRYIIIRFFEIEMEDSNLKSLLEKTVSCTKLLPIRLKTQTNTYSLQGDEVLIEKKNFLVSITCIAVIINRYTKERRYDM